MLTRTTEKIKVLFSTRVDGAIVETISIPGKQKTAFLVHKDGNSEIMASIFDDQIGAVVKPIAFRYVADSVLTLPSSLGPLLSTPEMIEKVNRFISKYLDVDDQEMEIITLYAIATWIYDSFEKFPLLRFLGAHGTGKSRALNLLRAISYHTINLGTAQTSANLYRSLRLFGGGTLILDEANFYSTKKEDDLTKVLLAGYEKGKPVSRTNMSTGEQEFFPTYGPKILANHSIFDDIALESRAITINMRTTSNPDISVSLPDPFTWVEAEEIRAMLLAYRLHSLTHGIHIPEYQEFRELEGRTVEIFLPLAFICGRDRVSPNLLEAAIDHEKDLSVMVESDMDTIIARVALELIEKGVTSIFAKEIAKKVEEEIKHPVTPKQVSTFLRLYGAQSKKWGVAYRLHLSNLNVALLSKRYCARD